MQFELFKNSIKRLTWLNKYRVLIISVAIAFLFALWGINSWKFSYVGDEWEFFEYALGLSKKHLLVNPFDLQGVYTTNGVIGSIWQGLFTWLFSPVNWAWRLSNIILIIPTTVFIYKWLELEFGLEMAKITTLMLSGSFFIANYFKIGYTNPIAFLLLAASLCLASRVRHFPNMKNVLLFGVCLGSEFLRLHWSANPVYHRRLFAAITVYRPKTVWVGG